MVGVWVRQLNVLVSDELFEAVGQRAAGCGWSVARTVRVALEVGLGVGVGVVAGDRGGVAASGGFSGVVGGSGGGDDFVSGVVGRVSDPLLDIA